MKENKIEKVSLSDLIRKELRLLQKRYSQRSIALKYLQEFFKEDIEEVLRILHLGIES